MFEFLLGMLVGGGVVYVYYGWIKGKVEGVIPGDPPPTT